MNFDFPLEDQDLTRFGGFAVFITREGQLELGVGNPNPAIHQQLSVFEQQFQADDDFSQCCLAALWLFQNDLEKSHAISQSVHSAEGSYLHGVMHRREGDFSNAKYWFRKAGDLGFFESLAKQIQADSLIVPNLIEELSNFDPFLLTDLVRDCSTAEKNSLERVTYRELLAAFEHCFDRAP